MAKATDRRVLPRLAAGLRSQALDLCDEAELIGLALSGDASGAAVADVEVLECSLGGVRLTGASFERSRLADCVVTDADLSGVVLDDCSLQRVEFRSCRLSGLQAAGCRFADVGFVDCRLDGANFRMSAWERADFAGCDLADADFYDAGLSDARLLRCDLSRVQLSKARLDGADLRGSTLADVQGADSLRNVTIGTDQVIPMALAVFGALGVVVDDGDA
jgi:uncharacterized protein YjbI with pentapeptide repeats